MNSVMSTTVCANIGSEFTLREDKKRARLAALLGMEEPAERTEHRPKVAAQNLSRDAESLIEFVDKPTTFARIACRVCGRDFLANRANVACCSDKCRAEELATLGIKWDWSKPPEERWYVSSQGGKLSNEPLVVPPAALKALMDALALWNPTVDNSVEL
jgi:hypothetical protein